MIVVTTDQEWVEHLEAYSVAFEAVRLGEPWNGFATPVVTEATLKVIIARQNFWHLIVPETSRMALGPAGLLIEYAPDGNWSVVATRDADGNYDLAGLGWTWTAIEVEDEYIDEDEPARIMMTITKEGTVE